MRKIKEPILIRKRKEKTTRNQTKTIKEMKFFVLLFALAVCASAQRPSVVIKTEVDLKMEIPSVSAMIVTELLETTFHVPSELAKEIGHIFRNVPLSIAKEMVAFIVKVFGDLTSNHLGSLSQYAAQAAHIFGQVWEHIDVNEVIALVANELLPPRWAEIIIKLVATLGPFARVCFKISLYYLFYKH